MARVASLSAIAMLDQLEAAAGRHLLRALLERKAQAVIRHRSHPLPLVLHEGRAYHWRDGWYPHSLRSHRNQVVTTYPISASHLTLSLLRDVLMTMSTSPQLPGVADTLRLYGCLCPLTLLGIPDAQAGALHRAITARDQVSSRRLRPPGERS
ncbi:hypothetical protein GCM10008019_28710 [Deinococcus soli (ex Cha et al. 2016)]|nr:hypothetical protein GCM10008019_28710 [Deinococcus soli (ex Cha et al. 2016)]